MSTLKKTPDFLPNGLTCPIGQQPITAKFMPSLLAAKKTNREGNTTREEQKCSH